MVGAEEFGQERGCETEGSLSAHLIPVVTDCGHLCPSPVQQMFGGRHGAGGSGGYWALLLLHTARGQGGKGSRGSRPWDWRYHVWNAASVINGFINSLSPTRAISLSLSSDLSFLL